MTSSGQAWTLIARFSNNDAKNWMKDNGEWWCEESVSVGKRRHALASILVDQCSGIQDHAQ